MLKYYIGGKMELDIMLKIILMVCCTFLFVALFIPIVKKIAEHVGALDMPNARKVHKSQCQDLVELEYMLDFYLDI